jgi:uncharacterized protein (DUF433 family)
MIDSEGNTIMVDWTDLITIDPDIRGGKPCIRGTRIRVYDILEYMAGGMSEAEILADFRSLKTEHLRAVLMYAKTSGYVLVSKDKAASKVARCLLSTLPVFLLNQTMCETSTSPQCDLRYSATSRR